MGLGEGLLGEKSNAWGLGRGGKMSARWVVVISWKAYLPAQMRDRLEHC